MVVGSDQVWNLDWFTPEYFFDFAKDYNGRLVSYAACFGHADQSEDLLKKVGNWLTRLDGISVRNDFSKRLTYAACKRDAFVVTDPTLLVDLNTIARQPTLPFEPYILLYGLSLKRYTQLVPFFKIISKQLRLHIVAIKSDALQDWDMSEMDFIVRNPYIEEWLGLFQNATFVLTDSFHGTLISIKNRVPFINYIGTDSKFERVAYIQKRYNIYQGFDVEHIPEDITTMFDFDSIRAAMQLHIEESRGFLEEQLCVSTGK
jgi:polysaccharide pyruvyl transferase WcaK-like protein